MTWSARGGGGRVDVQPSRYVQKKRVTYLAHAVSPSKASRRLLHKGDTAISHIRFDSVEIVQQDAFKQPVETPCKGWENCLRIAMGHKRRRCINANWMGQSGCTKCD